ncbi:sugar-binding transcriptional regulator [Grimontia sp. NTOU-MAR1]|uniref:sugar-binding transcriptional regulator n=1 Tax=Grimontia sp. NTOU-MAR1 TaxID=3111011 RepID=UPI002DBC6D94|nr:sugar-binding domain-containing protein [Grimontia sp. NTOU-MAR1]WRV99043.1 sugar-binding domain-containing protein [Grimontia sp. NTOU-MAR1]
MPRELIEDSDAFITEVCWHYYVNEMTQAEIARQMNVTRLRVNQAIQRAKSLGFVKIKIESPFTQKVQLQEQLKQVLGLKRAIVGPANRAAYDYHKSVGAALAELLVERLATGEWKSLGVSWGLTLDATIQKLPSLKYPNLEVVSILGGTAKGSTLNSFGVASGFAHVLGAKFSLLAAPIYLSEGIDRDLFLSQDVLRQHIEKFKSLDAVLLTCSNVSNKSFLIEHGLPKGLTSERLISSGAIGDVLGQFLDRQGCSVSEDVDNRTVGMPLSDVMSVPEKILAAAGPHKVEVIRVACRRGLVDTLVTDDVTAELILGGDSSKLTMKDR